MTAPRAEMLARVDAFVSANESRHAKAKARGQVEVHLSIEDFDMLLRLARGYVQAHAKVAEACPDCPNYKGRCPKCGRTLDIEANP